MLVHDAAIKNDLVQIQKLAKEKGMDFVKSPDLRKNTILHLACEFGFENILDYSLDIGMDVNKSNDAGDSPLILATKRGDLESVKKLVLAGSKINHSNKHGNTALHYACFWRWTEIALFLTKTANAYVKISNNYKQLPADQTSNILKITMEEIAKTQGNEIIRAESLNDIEELGSMMDLTLNTDWLCTPEEIQIGSVIVENEQSTTYEGEWRKQRVVIKLPKLAHEPTERDLSVLKQELSGIKRATHPNLLPLLGSCLIYPDTCYLVPFEEKGNLKVLLDDVNVDLSPGDALSMATQICKGLLYLHEMKPTHIAHGKLKTSNVIVRKNGTVALTDFGFSKSIFSGRLVIPETYSEVDWLPPEALLGVPPDDDRTSDIYCFGLVLYSIIARQPLYYITNPMVIGYLVAIKGMTPDVPEFIPQLLTVIMMQCWAPAPTVRPTIQAVDSKLKAFKF